MNLLTATIPPGDGALEQAAEAAESIASAIGAKLPLTDPVLVFALVMALILIAPFFMSRLKLPGIIGLLVAGMIVGPHGLGLLERDTTIVLLGTVGLLYIMFLAGIEIDLDDLFRHRNNSLVFGLMTFAVPQVLGTVMALTLLEYNWPAAILLASMFASHTLVSYPVAARLGLVRNRAVSAAVGGTIITDTLALLVLAIIAAYSTGELSIGFWARFGISTTVFVAICLVVVPRIGRWFFRSQTERGPTEYVFVMVVAFGCAGLAMAAGLEGIIGVFLAGLALNRLIPAQSVLMNRIHFTGEAIFVPCFLLSVGMIVDLKILVAGPEAWLVSGSMVVAVVVTKFLAAVISGKLLGFSSAEGQVMFGLSVPQAAATLAAVFVGYRIGLFDEKVLNGAVMMILVTCILGPWVVDHFGRRVAIDEQAAPSEPGQNLLRILIPLANPQSATLLMETAIAIRRQNSTEPLYPLTVAFEGGDVAAKVAAGERMLGYAVTHASAAGVPVHAVTRVDTSIANGVSRAIVELRISTVVIGWSGEPSARRMIFGSVIDQLLESNPQTFLLCRLQTPLNTTRRVIMVVPRFLEREHGFGEAARTVKLMTSRLGAKLVVAAADSEIKHLQPRIGAIKPQVATTFTPVSPLSNVVPRLQSMIETDDLIVLMSTREGRLAWTPELDRLPQRLAAEFPGTNLIVFYGSEQSSEARAAASAAIPGTSGLLAPERVALGVSAMPFDQALEHVLRPHFRTLPAALREVREALIRNANEYSTEMSPGVALLHAHVTHVSSPTFFLATCPQGLTLPRISRPVRMMLVLLSPADLPPEKHLQSLANIGRLMRSPEVVNKVIGVTSFGELDQLFTPQGSGSTAPGGGVA